MSGIFLSILELSASAIWLILAILAVRPFLRKIPKWGMVLLWGLVGLRLLLPFSIESRFSLIPGAETAGDMDIIEFAELPATEQVMPAVDVGILPLFSVLWFVGVVFLVGHFSIRYWHILKKLDTAVLLRENIYLSEWISAPVVIGLLKPKIVVPFSVDETSMKHIIAHEKAHIRRGDHWWKLLAYGILTLHWFNPFVWIAYLLLGRDIELACDEAVVKTMDSNSRADYTQALVTCAAGKGAHKLPLLGFGTVGIRTRVKCIMNYRKPTALSHLLLAFISVLLSVCFLTNPVNATVEQTPDTMIPEQHRSQEEQTARPTKDLTGINLQDEPIRREIEDIEEMLDEMRKEVAEYPKQYESLDKKYWLGLKSTMDFYQEVIPQLEARLQRLKDQIGMK